MLNKKFFERKAEVVARELLGKILVRKMKGEILKAKIVETEAYYGEDDPASRAKRDGDLRRVMKSEAGTILVYGVHSNWLINFVTGKQGKAEAILLRALQPLNFSAKTSGPGLLTKALKINKSFHKQNILSCKKLWLENCKEKPSVKEDFRVGVKEDLPKKLRFYIEGNKFVSLVGR